jgi:hypothetical protein
MLWLLAAGGALLGAGLGAWNTGRERKRQEKELKMQKDNATSAYNYGQALSDSQYSTQKGEALWQLGMQDRSLREGMNQFTNEYNTQMLARAFGEQDARIQTASGIGGSLVQEGMSGTRGNEANQLVRDYAANSLERQIEVSRQQDANMLAGTVSNANRAITAMKHERDSWDPGGYRYSMKTAQDNYNKQMYELGQDNYEYQIKDMNSWDNKFLDFTSGIFGGASSGLSFGASLYGYNYNWGTKH